MIESISYDFAFLSDILKCNLELKGWYLAIHTKSTLTKYFLLSYLQLHRAIIPYYMYVDVTTIYFNLEDFPALNRELEINKEPEKLNIWFQLNKLTLNMDKTKCMFFSQTSSCASH